MPTKHPRVMVTLEQPLHQWVARSARADGTSVSLKVRDLLREAYEQHEDAWLEKLATQREKTFDRRTALTTDQARARLGLKRR